MPEGDRTFYQNGNGHFETNGNGVCPDGDHPVIDKKYIFADPYHDGQLVLIGERTIYLGYISISAGEFQIGIRGEETVVKGWYSPVKPEEREYKITDQVDEGSKNEYLLFTRNGSHMT